MFRLKSILRPLRRKGFSLKFIYSDDYWMVDLKNHVFPVKKYRRIYEQLLSQGARREDFITPVPATEEDILLVHHRRYVKKLKTGRLSPSEILSLELPYSPELFRFALLHVGGTIRAAEVALEEGLAVNIGGGFHHAFADHGEGFCVFNDVAVAVEKLRRGGMIGRAMVIDCDVHQGNGTATIFAGREDVFTFSIHQMDLYPAHKASSSLDVELWSGDGDAPYLRALKEYFPRLFQEYNPDLVFFLAGADPYERDQLGGLSLTIDGLKEGGRIIIDEARKMRLPVVVLLAGGYAYDVEDTVAIHLNTIRIAQRAQRRYGFPRRSKPGKPPNP